MAAEGGATSEDAVLGGRLVLRQPLCAAIASAMTPSCWRRRSAARAGDHAVDLGAGVGAAGLALARRVEGSP